MTEIKQIYRCKICGNITEVIHNGFGELVCCGQPMELLKAKTSDTGEEKHVPIIEIKEDEVVVKVGSIPHPMEEGHYIEMIEIIADNQVYRKFLKARDKAEAVFKIKADKIEAREYCNLHGLWSSEK